MEHKDDCCCAECKKKLLCCMGPSREREVPGRLIEVREEDVQLEQPQAFFPALPTRGGVVFPYPRAIGALELPTHQYREGEEDTPKATPPPSSCGSCESELVPVSSIPTKGSEKAKAGPSTTEVQVLRHASGSPSTPLMKRPRTEASSKPPKHPEGCDCDDCRYEREHPEGCDCDHCKKKRVHPPSCDCPECPLITVLSTTTE
ncbi:uncharacterized protein LOC144105320 [Amblyomma americanum]